MRPWLRIAHRGAAGHAPEHTLAAFEMALAQHAQMIEFDVRLTADEELVVFHDETLERTTPARGRVREATWAEICTLDAGSWFSPEYRDQRPLRLRDVLEWANGRVPLNIELKEPASEAAVLLPRLLRELRAAKAVERVVISAFDWELLVKLRERDPQARIGILWHDPALTAEAWQLADRIAASSVHPLWGLAGPELVSAAHERNLQVYVWTVNDESWMRSLVACGVDGMISDFPDRLWKVAQG